MSAVKKAIPTEYMYASARLRALERHIVGRERVAALMECRTEDEVMARLAEYGIIPESGSADAADGEAQSAAREGMLLDILRTAYAEAEAAVPDPAPLRAYRYPYDCNNLKVAVKCQIRGMSPAGLLFDFGTVPAARVEEILREGKGLEQVPPAMAAAVPAAREAYAATGDPCRIDALLDRACYADMAATLSGLGSDTVMGWLRARIDLLNILITLRIIRMERGEAGRVFLTDTLLPGGTLAESFFTAAYASGEAGLWAAVVPTPYSALPRLLGDAPALRLCEQAADDLLMSRIREGARVPFGPEVAAGYLLGVETSVRNVRILLAAKAAGLSQETLRERVRMSYV